MKIITDNKIPFVEALFSAQADVISLPGNKISQADLLDADILLTRTITQVTPELLINTAIRFIGSATTGTDHIDLSFLKKNNIALATAAGANATAVADYVLSCAAKFAEKGMLKSNATIGVIGCGRIGYRVAQLFKQLNFSVICCDPYVHHNDCQFVDLDTLLMQSDLITLHTPLTHTGIHPTFHLVNRNNSNKIKSGSILINASRGGVIDQRELLKRNDLIICLDTWEDEPAIDKKLLKKVFIATPHIAGYTLEAKRRATDMLYQEAAKKFGWPSLQTQHTSDLASITFDKQWHEKILAQFNPLALSNEFKEAILKADSSVSTVFETQRQRPFRKALVL